MGCDIHAYYEVRDQNSGQWEQHDWTSKWIPEGQDLPDWRAMFETGDPFHISRNYHLFSILADVRNGSGFAGTKTGEGFNPICLPRGLPDDLSESVDKENLLVVGVDCDNSTSKSWLQQGLSIMIDSDTVTNPDYHSHSWHTLTELRSFDWTQMTQLQGWVGAEDYQRFKDGEPHGYSGSVSGNKVRHISIPEMEQCIANGNTNHAYTLIVWNKSYADCCRDFVENTIPAMNELAEDPDNVRLVFWFDN